VPQVTVAFKDLIDGGERCGEIGVHFSQAMVSAFWIIDCAQIIGSQKWE